MRVDKIRNERVTDMMRGWMKKIDNGKYRMRVLMIFT